MCRFPASGSSWKSFIIERHAAAALASRIRAPSAQLASPTANRVQEQAFGTLNRATLKLLDGLARRGGGRRSERNLKIATVLVRDYQGRRHTVTVGPDGYVWEGQPYSSLSAIARAITGTAWSGPRFFALKATGIAKTLSAFGGCKVRRSLIYSCTAKNLSVGSHAVMGL
jgi:hypothetical protein